MDVHKRADICRHLQRSADRVARRLRRKSLVAGGVRVRLKTTDFHLMSRQCTLTDPTDVADVLYRAAEGLLDRFDLKGPFRLIGLTAHNIREQTPEQYLPTQQTLALDDEDAGARRRLETTLDDLATRFGDDVVRRASDVADRRNTLIEDSADLDDLTNFSGE